MLSLPHGRRESHHSALVSTQRGVNLRECISAVSRQLIKYAPNIQSQISLPNFSTFHLPIVSALKLLKTLKKINNILIGSEKPSDSQFFASNKTHFLGDSPNFFSHWNFSSNMHAVSIAPDDSP